MLAVVNIRSIGAKRSKVKAEYSARPFIEVAQSIEQDSIFLLDRNESGWHELIGAVNGTLNI